MFRRNNLPNIVRRGVEPLKEPDDNETITIHDITRIQQHKFNPHEPIFLSVRQYEEICKNTYDGNVPFTITAIVGQDEKKKEEGVEESKNDEQKSDGIIVTEVKEVQTEDPYVPKKVNKSSRRR
jgi:hypothetical protein